MKGSTFGNPMGHFGFWRESNRREGVDWRLRGLGFRNRKGRYEGYRVKERRRAWLTWNKIIIEG